jgi:Excalibur calcium-binding domain
MSRYLTMLLAPLLLISTAVVYAQDAPADSLPVSDQTAPATSATPPGHVGPDTVYPNSALTPGAVFPEATADAVCVVGYSGSVRNVTTGERLRVYAEYGISDVPGADEVDHLIPVELGGSNDLNNLWPEPYFAPGAHEKDRVENYLHDQVCGGAISLGDAQQAIVRDWYAVYVTLPPAPVPDRPATVAVTPLPAPAPPTSTPANSTVYYANCAAARAAGAAPLHRGQPGYRAALDRDNDGVACE